MSCLTSSLRSPECGNIRLHTGSHCKESCPQRYLSTVVAIATRILEARVERGFEQVRPGDVQGIIATGTSPERGTKCQ
jgi:hypothetical protein